MVKVGQGQTDNLTPLAVKLFIEEYPRYEKVTDSMGIPRNAGGASALLSASSLSYDEADSLLHQFGLSLYTPGAEVTIVLPDVFRIPTKFYGIAELELYKTEGDWWSDFRIKLTGLVPAWL